MILMSYQTWRHNIHLYMMIPRFTKLIAVNKWCMSPSGHCWNYYPGTLSCSQVSPQSSYGLQWFGLKIGDQGSSSRDGHQGDMPCWLSDMRTIIGYADTDCDSWMDFSNKLETIWWPFCGHYQMYCCNMNSLSFSFKFHLGLLLEGQ